MAIKTNIERRSQRCVHFTGIQNDTCAAGVRYDGLKPRIPCLGYVSGTSETMAECVLIKLSTPEELKLAKRERQIGMERFLVVLAGAHEHAKAAGLKRGNGGRGELPCPSGCGGTLRYSVAAINGHMHAVCSTYGCASWME